MNKRRIVTIGLFAAVAVALVACRKPAEQVPKEGGKRVAKIQEEKNAIDAKLRDIERSRALIEERNREELENIRRSIESIQNALDQIQQQLDAMGSSPPPEKALSRPRLPLEISILLIAIAVFCILILIKLRRMRSRETRKSPAEGITIEPKKEKDSSKS